MRSKLFILVALFIQIPGEAAWDETWYLMRGKSNVEIGNHKAAAEAFEKVVEKNPSHREALRLLGASYEAQGQTDKAIEQYDRYLEKYPDDREIALKQADFLTWSRYSYRKKDAIKYYKLSLRSKDDPKVRLKYARLLSENKQTSGAAIGEYKRVLAREPRNATAHRELAKVYAWNDEKDLALRHSQLAREYGGADSELSRVDRDLRKGREPELGLGTRFILQPGQTFGLSGISVFPLAKVELGPFVTARLKGGYEQYWITGDEVQGGFFFGEGQYRLSSAQALSLGIGGHSLRKGSNGLVFKAEYLSEESGSALTLGFKRELRDDSFLSLVGKPSGTSVVGAARSHLFYARVPVLLFDRDAHFEPYFGWISAGSVSSNLRLGAIFEASLSIGEGESHQLAVGYLAQIDHYGSDHSGFGISASEPFAGGYFSPKLFFGQTPCLRMSFSLRERDALVVSAGPSLQVVSDLSALGTFRLGGQAVLSYLRYLGKTFFWKIDGNFVSVGSVYHRFELQNQLVHSF